MIIKKRMKSEERRLIILQTAKPLFAMNGFNGTSVKEIAKAADVSEALLYKHFSSKADIYNEILSYGENVASHTARELDRIKPGAEKLVMIVYLMFEQVLFDVPGQNGEQEVHERFMFNSFLENGNYARAHFKSLENASWHLIEECYQVAEENAHLVDMPISFTHRAWFVHHLAMALNLCHLPETPAFEYEGSKEELSEQATFFALRGIGLTDEAIRRFFKPDELRALKRTMYQGDIH